MRSTHFANGSLAWPIEPPNAYRNLFGNQSPAKYDSFEYWRAAIRLGLWVDIRRCADHISNVEYRAQLTREGEKQ